MGLFDIFKSDEKPKYKKGKIQDNLKNYKKDDIVDLIRDKNKTSDFEKNSGILFGL